jgi:radical SAM superfamily enzyme YgiQ (UPF0313 family)
MPHVAFVPFTGLRVCDPELLDLGMTLPGLQARSSALQELPALGLLTLAGMLPENWTCSYHSISQPSDELLQNVLAESPAIVALSALTASVEQAYRFGDQLKHAGTRVVIGGLHATTLPEEAQLHSDAVVVGEGEPVWERLLTDVETGDLQSQYGSVDGTSWSNWPLPRFDLLGSEAPRFTLQTERGCPLACEFCAASRLLGVFRVKPTDAVQRELSAICRVAGSPFIELADDNTFVRRADADELCEALGNANVRYFTEVDWRIGERPELLGKLAKSGCVQVLLGIESLVFRYPGMGAKQADLDRVMNAVVAIQGHGIAVNGCFIIGADGETQASVARLVDFVLDSPLADVQLTLQTPFPGTALRRRLESQSRILSDRGWSYYTLLDVTFQPDLLTALELEQTFRAAIRAVYSPAASARRNRIRRQVWRRHPRLCAE